jgi:tetratricopeptide (TPR) repeat protein
MASSTGFGVRWTHRVPVVGTIFLLSVGCGGGEPGEPAVTFADQDASAMLSAGNVSGALAAWKENYSSNPNNTDNAVGAAYAALLEGRLVEADAILAKAEPTAGAALGGIRVRRTLIALEMGDNAKVLEYGKSSGVAEGQVLAAEAALCDSDWDSAKALFSPIRTAPAPVGTTASVYVERLEEEDPVWGTLAEAEACWALGQRSEAVDTIQEVFEDLPITWDNRAEEALVWAGRALREGQADVAKGLIKKTKGLPAFQKWRLAATQAHILCANGDAKGCVRKLEGLDSSAPAMGRSHARAMGAMLLGSDHADEALRLLGEDHTVASAFAAHSIGDSAEAMRHAPSSFFRTFLKGRP